MKNELPSTLKAFRYQQHRWSCGPANLFRKMAMEILTNKVCFFLVLTFSQNVFFFFLSPTHYLFYNALQKVSLWKKLYVIYSFFFVRKIVGHIVTFVFYCVVLPATVLVPEVVVPTWGAVYIPSIITLLNAVGTPRSLSPTQCYFV